MSHSRINFALAQQTKFQNMFEKYRLKRKLKVVSNAKNKEINNQNFEAAANLREEEKALLKQLAELRNNRKSN